VERTTPLNLRGGIRFLSFVSGLCMAAASILTIRHFFLANYPESIYQGTFCDISAFFNCDSSAFSAIAQVMGIPIGYFGVAVGILVALGAVFPTERFARTNAFIALFNALGAVLLFFYSVFVMGSLCLLCTGFYVFALMSFVLFWLYGAGKGREGIVARFFRPSFKILAAAFFITALGAYGMMEYHNARKMAQSAAILRVVNQFRELPVVGNPSFISPYWTVRSTERFEDAPIQVVEYADFLCPDCQYLTQQLNQLKEEFGGKINVAFQFFPLEGRCNAVVDKDIHPGACELCYIAAFDPSKFLPIHDEVFANLNDARDPQWRQDLARRHGVEQALEDSATRELVQTIINTGMEYEKTSERYAHGVRSTPTMIINGRMVIGTLPYEQMRAIFQDLVDEYEGRNTFIENWVPPKARKVKR